VTVTRPEVVSFAKKGDSKNLEIPSTFPREIRAIGFNADCVSAIFNHRDSMGQQLRVKNKRKRRRAYLERKKESHRAATKRPAPAKQQAQKQSGAAE